MNCFLGDNELDQMLFSCWRFMDLLINVQNKPFFEFSSAICNYWAACAPSHKMGFRSSVSKSGLPGEGRHQGLVPRNDVLTMVSYEFLLHEPLHGYFLYLVCAPPEKPTKRCEPEEGYLRRLKRFDHGSHSIIFLLFEFKSVR